MGAISIELFRSLTGYEVEDCGPNEGVLDAGDRITSNGRPVTFEAAVDTYFKLQSGSSTSIDRTSEIFQLAESIGLDSDVMDEAKRAVALAKEDGTISPGECMALRRAREKIHSLLFAVQRFVDAHHFVMEDTRGSRDGVFRDRCFEARSVIDRAIEAAESCFRQ